MLVSFNSSALAEIMRDLRGCGSLCLPVSAVPVFVAYCNRNGLHPNGGALVCLSSGEMAQFLYI